VARWQLPGSIAVAACVLIAGCHRSTGARQDGGDVVPSSAPYAAQCGQWLALSPADKKLALLRLYSVDISVGVVYGSSRPTSLWHRCPCSTTLTLGRICHPASPSAIRRTTHPSLHISRRTPEVQRASTRQISAFRVSRKVPSCGADDQNCGIGKLGRIALFGGPDPLDAAETVTDRVQQ
jgi:hypothetical protein